MPGSGRGEEQGVPGAARLLDCRETGLKAQCQEMASHTLSAGKKPGSCAAGGTSHMPAGRRAAQGCVQLQGSPDLKSSWSNLAPVHHKCLAADRI